MDTPPISLELAQQVLASQPFSQFIGAEITRFDTLAELRINLRPEHMQQHGFAHGGVISYLADNALTFAGGLALGPMLLTAEYKINYVKPGKGDALVARAEVVSAGKSQCVCRCDVFALDGDAETLCATALGTIVAFGK